MQQVSEISDKDDINIQVSRFGRRIKRKKYPGFEDNIISRLNRTVIKDTNTDSLMAQKASNDQTKKSSKNNRKPKGKNTTILFSCHLRIITN